MGWPTALPGVRRLEWHEASIPDGAFLRLPVPGLVVVLNVAARGEWRRHAGEPWRPQPAASVRGLTLHPTLGRDPDAGALGYVSIVLAPWAAPLYLRAPAAAFVDDIVDLALVAPGWPALVARVAGAPSAAARCALVEAELHTLGARWSPVAGGGRGAPASARLGPVAERALVEALERGEAVTTVAAALGVTPRRVHQRTRALCGVAPRDLAQLARFGRGIEALQREASGEALAAWRAEHADQPHAIRAFRRFAWLTPGQYAASRRAIPRTRFAVAAPASAAPGAER